MKWTKEEDELLIKLKSEGFSIVEIAARLRSRTVPAVKSRIHKLRPPVINVAPKQGIPWTESEEKELVNSLNLGYSVHQCARMLGRSEGSIRSRINKFNLFEKYSEAKNPPSEK